MMFPWQPLYMAGSGSHPQGRCAAVTRRLHRLSPPNPDHVPPPLMAGFTDLPACHRCVHYSQRFMISNCPTKVTNDIGGYCGSTSHHAVYLLS